MLMWVKYTNSQKAFIAEPKVLVDIGNIQFDISLGRMYIIG